jgi:hypothetical protein
VSQTQIRRQPNLSRQRCIKATMGARRLRDVRLGWLELVPKETMSIGFANHKDLL